MKNEKLLAWLKSLKACTPALDWLEGRSLEEAWAECPRGDWMLWLAYKAGVALRPLTLAKGRCAELVLHLMEDQRSREAVAVAIRFGLGHASREELDRAAASAYAAAAAAFATAFSRAGTPAAVLAFAAAAAAAYSADAAADGGAAVAFATAYSAADAAAAYSADAAAAKEEMLSRCAQVCRQYIPVIPVQLLTTG